MSAEDQGMTVEEAFAAMARELRAIRDRLEPRSEQRYRNPADRDARYDFLGRKQPRRVDFGLVLRAVPGLAQRMRVVPAVAVAEEGRDGDGEYALVACPCGQRRIVRSLICQCAGCERWYLLSGDGPLVAYGAMDLPSPAARP